MSSASDTAPTDFTEYIRSIGSSLYSAGLFVKKHGYRYGGSFLFIVTTTTMITLLPLIFETTREATAIEGEKIQVEALKNKGFSDRQLQEMGFSDISLHKPSVAMGTN